MRLRPPLDARRACRRDPNVLVLPSPFFSDGDTIRLLEPADCDTRAVLGQVVLRGL
jgi:hypothetical protein